MTIHYRAPGAGSSQQLKPTLQKLTTGATLAPYSERLYDVWLAAGNGVLQRPDVCCPCCVQPTRMEVEDGVVLCLECHWGAEGEPWEIVVTAAQHAPKLATTPKSSRLESARVTLYKNVRDKVGATVALSSIITVIKEDEGLQKQTAAIRETLGANGRAAYDEAKKQLQAIAPSGEFSQRGNAGLVDYSHLVSFDVDKLTEKNVQLEELKAQIGADPHCVFVFTSPSGDGLKGFVWVDSGSEDHGAAFAALQDYIEDKFKIRPDGACKDLGRLCFLASDPGVIVNEDALSFDWRSQPKKEAESQAIVEDGPAEEFFPLDALPLVMQQLAASCAEVHQVDAALPAVAAMTTMAAALGRAVKCQGAVNGRTTPCNNFSVVAAPSGYGKGVAAVVVRPLLDASIAIGKKFDTVDRAEIASGVLIAEARKREIINGLKGSRLAGPEEAQARRDLAALHAEIDAAEFSLKSRPCLLTGSITGAALSVSLKRNDEQLLLYSLEAGDCIRVAGGQFTKDNKGDYDLYLSAYSGESFAESRVSRDSVQLEEPCLNILWMVQPILLRELYGSEEAQERGLLARFNVLICDRDITPFDDDVHREVSPELLSQWKSFVAAALNLRMSGREVIFQASPDAATIFRNWHNEAVAIRNGEGRENESKLARCRENAIRLATVLAATEWLGCGGIGDAPELTAQHAARGVELGRFFVAQTVILTHAAVTERRDNRLAKLLELVKRDGEITLRILKCSHGFGESEVRSIVVRNPSLFCIEKRKPGARGGQPSTVLRLATGGNAGFAGNAGGGK